MRARSECVGHYGNSAVYDNRAFGDREDRRVGVRSEPRAARNHEVGGNSSYTRSAWKRSMNSAGPRMAGDAARPTVCRRGIQVDAINRECGQSRPAQWSTRVTRIEVIRGPWRCVASPPVRSLRRGSTCRDDLTIDVSSGTVTDTAIRRSSSAWNRPVRTMTQGARHHSISSRCCRAEMTSVVVRLPCDDG